MTTRNNIVETMVVTDASSASLYINICGPPIAQPRQRFRQLRNRRWFYNPAGRASKLLARKIVDSLVEVGVPPGELPFFSNPVKVKVTFGVVNMNQDLDNLLKFILDTFQVAKVYSNDRVVYKIEAEKCMSDTGFTIVEVLMI